MVEVKVLEMQSEATTWRQSHSQYQQKCTWNFTFKPYYSLDILTDTLPDIDALDTIIYCPGSINLKPIGVWALMISEMILK
jgi:hypothetical protein